MATKESIERLLLVVEHLHKCRAVHVASAPVHEVFRGETVWKRNVEVYDLAGHPKAKRCYGWTYDEPAQFITILELPPVDSPESAVKVGVAYQIKKRQNRKIKPKNGGWMTKLRRTRRRNFPSRLVFSSRVLLSAPVSPARGWQHTRRMEERLQNSVPDPPPAFSRLQLLRSIGQAA